MNWILTVERENGTQTFEGFIPFTMDGGDWIKNCKEIAIVFHCNQYECFAIDPENPIAIDEIRRFFRQELGHEDADNLQILICHQETNGGT